MEEDEPMDEDTRPNIQSEEEVRAWLDEPLRAFLERFTEHPEGDLALLHTRPMMAILEQLGYLLEERMPPVENMEQRDLSVFGYLQIADRLPSGRVIALDLDEFNRLIAEMIRDQYGVYARSYRPRQISFERLRELASIVVRDPTGVLHGPAEPESQKPSTSALSASASATSPSSMFPVNFKAAEGFLKSFRSALLASTAFPVLGAMQQTETPKTPVPQASKTSASAPQYAPLPQPQPVPVFASSRR